MQTTDKNEIKKIVVEVLDEILAQTQPPDRLAFLFYNYMNDFHDFKRMVTTKFTEIDERFDKVDERFDKVDERFDKVEARLDNCLTKDEFNVRMVDYIEKIGVSVRKIVKEEIQEAFPSSSDKKSA